MCTDVSEKHTVSSIRQDNSRLTSQSLTLEIQTSLDQNILMVSYDWVLQVFQAGLCGDIINGKAIPLQAWTGPEGSKRLRLLDFKTIGT
jgi:hypothetical protein